MSQTNWIAAFLVLGFIVYIITRGQLQQYQAIVFGASQQNNNPHQQNNNPQTPKTNPLPVVPALSSQGQQAQGFGSTFAGAISDNFEPFQIPF